MANKKRININHRLKLGRVRWTRADVLAIENILRKHAGYRNKVMRQQYIATGEPKSDVESADFSDIHIEVSYSLLGGRGFKLNRYSVALQMGVEYKYDFDSIKDIPENRYIPHVRIIDKPDISVELGILSSHIYVNRNSRNKQILKSLDTASARIVKRLT